MLGNESSWRPIVKTEGIIAGTLGGNTFNESELKLWFARLTTETCAIGLYWLTSKSCRRRVDKHCIHVFLACGTKMYIEV
jgi:hypothetical protein